MIKIPIGVNNWNVETYRNKLENNKYRIFVKQLPVKELEIWNNSDIFSASIFWNLLEELESFFRESKRDEMVASASAVSRLNWDLYWGLALVLGPIKNLCHLGYGISLTVGQILPKLQQRFELQAWTFNVRYNFEMIKYRPCFFQILTKSYRQSTKIVHVFRKCTSALKIKAVVKRCQNKSILRRIQQMFD